MMNSQEEFVIDCFIKKEWNHLQIIKQDCHAEFISASQNMRP